MHLWNILLFYWFFWKITPLLIFRLTSFWLGLTLQASPIPSELSESRQFKKIYEKISSFSFIDNLIEQSPNNLVIYITQGNQYYSHMNMLINEIFIAQP